MVDRLEELLALMEAEDEEEREDGLEIQWAKPSARAAPEAGEERDPPEPEAGDRQSPPPGPELWPGAAREAAAAPRDGALERRVLAEELEGAVLALRPAAEAAGRLETAGQDGGGPEIPLQEAGSGLEELYRRTAQAASPAAALALPVEQAGRIPPAEEPGRSAALAVDELDRAVRRDSRRYDGGMSIY